MKVRLFGTFENIVFMCQNDFDIQWMYSYN